MKHSRKNKTRKSSKKRYSKKVKVDHLLYIID